MNIKENDLYKIEGGAINAALLSAVARLIATVLDWGRAIGTSFYRYKSGKACR